jgi:uncharacterized integral membrane protein (TIGR00698 family)
MNQLPGVVVCIAIAIAAIALGYTFPIVGGPVLGIVIGLAIAGIVRVPARLEPGISFASKVLLQASIVLLGANLSFGQVVSSGARSLPVMLGTLALVLTAAYFIGKALGIERDLRRLLGAGTAICGGSAIAAVSSATDADRADVTYALSVIFLFNIVAVVTFPALGHMLHLSERAFGLWAGTAINDTSSVVAAGYAYGHDAGNQAVIVKLTRTLLIVPIVVFYAAKRIAAARSAGVVEWRSIVPWFVLWFALATALNGFGLIPAVAHAPLQAMAMFSIVVALAGVGLSADYAKIRSAGLRPLLLGFILWVLIAASSLALAHVFGLSSEACAPGRTTQLSAGLQ